MVVLPLILACESDSLKPPPIPDDRKLYWDLNLNHHAVTLSTTAPYDTLTLEVTPQNYLGEPLTGFPAPRYTSMDVERVLVTPEGVLRAVAPSSNVVGVIATLTTGNLKHEDTVYVKVVDNPAPPVLTSFSVHPMPPDSAKTAIGRLLPVRAIDAGGGLIADLPVYFSSSDRKLAVFKDPVGSSRQSFITPGGSIGAVTIYASTIAFGVAKADTLAYRIGRKLFAGIAVADSGNQIGSFSPFSNAHVIATGGSAAWSFPSMLVWERFYEAVDITFDANDLPHITAYDPVASPWGTVGFWAFSAPEMCTFGRGDCSGSGNSTIGGGDFSYFSSPPFMPLFAIRTFTAPGTYVYRSTIHGTQGKIIVIDDEE